MPTPSIRYFTTMKPFLLFYIYNKGKLENLKQFSNKVNVTYSHVHKLIHELVHDGLLEKAQVNSLRETAYKLSMHGELWVKGLLYD